MDVVRSSVGGGFVAVIVLSAFLLAADALFPDTTLFTTFTGLCAVGGPPYCELRSPAAAALTLVWYVGLFALAWPLLYGGFTWAIPGKTSVLHGVVYGLILWTGFAVVVSGGDVGGRTAAENWVLLLVMLVAYLVYGAVLGRITGYLVGD